MPRYQVVYAPAFVSGTLHSIGAEVEYDGWPGSTLEPVDDVAKRIKAYFDKNRRTRDFPRKPDLAQFAADPPTKSKPVKEPTDG